MIKFLDISIEELREVLGNETKSRYGTYYFRCPDCASMGKDTKGDNLVYNSSNGKLRCFGCGTGQLTALKMINEHRKSKNYVYKQKKQESPKKRITWYELNKDELLQYMCEANEELLQEKSVIDWLKNKHGINEKTIFDCGIGYDSDKNAVCFPIFSATNNQYLVGFEYRLIGDKKQIWRTKDSPSGISEIWGKKHTKYLIILEGYLDCYCFKQFLETKNIADDFYILSPSNGANDLLKNMNKIDFSKYKNCYLMLDNDETGSIVTDSIIKQYPFFIDKREILKRNDVKDFKEYWLKNNV